MERSDVQRRFKRRQCQVCPLPGFAATVLQEVQTNAPLRRDNAAQRTQEVPLAGFESIRVCPYYGQEDDSNTWLYVLSDGLREQSVIPRPTTLIGYYVSQRLSARLARLLQSSETYTILILII